MPTDKERYTAKLNELAQRYGNLEDSTARDIQRMLQQTRREIVAAISDASTTQAGTLALQQLQGNIDRLIADFENRANSALNTSLAGAVDFGGLAALEPLQELGFENLFLAPSRAQVNVLQGLQNLGAQLVTGITDDMRSVVNQQVALAAIPATGLSPLDAMQNITTAFGKAEVEQGKRVTKGISAKAETTIRTELQGAFNLANNSQGLETAKQIPGLLKRWLATADGRTRRGHLELHRDTARNPIPFSEQYLDREWRHTKARGWRLTGKTERLDYPTQLGKAGWSVINCRCTDVVIHPQIGVIGSSLDGRIGAMLKRAREQ